MSEEAVELTIPATGANGDAFGYNSLKAHEEKYKLRQSIADYVVSLEQRIIGLEIKVKHLLGAGYISGKIKERMNAELKRVGGK